MCTQGHMNLYKRTSQSGYENIGTVIWMRKFIIGWCLFGWVIPVRQRWAGIGSQSVGETTVLFREICPAVIWTDELLFGRVFVFLG